MQAIVWIDRSAWVRRHTYPIVQAIGRFLSEAEWADARRVCRNRLNVNLAAFSRHICQRASYELQWEYLLQGGNWR